MTYLAYLPDDSLSVVLLMNTEGPVSHVRLVEQAESLRWVGGGRLRTGRVGSRSCRGQERRRWCGRI